jgi:hypothetical protein
MMATKGKNNGHGNFDDLGIGLCDFDSAAFAGFSDADFGSLGLDHLGDASMQSVDLVGADFTEGAQGLDLELSDAENAIIRIAQTKVAGSRGRTASAKSEKIYITHEDFDEGPERDAFLLIYGYAEHLFDCPDKAPFNHGDIRKTKALEFFFCHQAFGICLEDAVSCIDNQIRVDVLRLRFMLEFWMRGWQLPPMPAEADGLPSRIELMAAQFGGMLGISIAKEAWFEPGISAAALLERVIDGRGAHIEELIKKSFNDLVCAYVLSISNGKVYTTGKNPILELEDRMNDPTVRVRGQLANICWSRRF